MSEKFAGNNLTLKVEDSPGAGTFTKVAGASSHTYTLSNGQADTTDKDSSRWGEFKPFGRRQISLTFNGFITDDAAFAKMKSAANSDASNLNYQIDYGDGDTVEGEFHIDTQEFTGEVEGAQTFNFSLSSSGEPTFT